MMNPHYEEGLTTGDLVDSGDLCPETGIKFSVLERTHFGFTGTRGKSSPRRAPVKVSL